MKEIEIGQIVFSKQGRDKAKPFVVVNIEDNFLYLVDGKLRKAENPKKKKRIHIQHTNYVDGNLKEKILKQSYLDSDFRTAIKSYLAEEG